MGKDCNDRAGLRRASDGRYAGPFGTVRRNSIPSDVHAPAIPILRAVQDKSMYTITSELMKLMGSISSS